MLQIQVRNGCPKCDSTGNVNGLSCRVCSRRYTASEANRSQRAPLACGHAAAGLIVTAWQCPLCQRAAPAPYWLNAGDVLARALQNAGDVLARALQEDGEFGSLRAALRHHLGLPPVELPPEPAADPEAQDAEDTPVLVPVEPPKPRGEPLELMDPWLPSRAAVYVLPHYVPDALAPGGRRANAYALTFYGLFGDGAPNFADEIARAGVQVVPFRRPSDLVPGVAPLSRWPDWGQKRPAELVQRAILTALDTYRKKQADTQAEQQDGKQAEA